MERLMREFEDGLKAESVGGKLIKVASPHPANSKVEEGSIFSLADVLKMEPKVYAKEGNRWLKEVWLPPKLAILSKILRVEDNQRRFEDLVESTVRGQVVPFVGAGMSMSSGVPSWGNLLNKLSSASTCDKALFNSLLKEGKYEAAADLLHANMRSELFDIQLRHSCQINIGQISGAIRYLPLIFTGLLLTTNFDQILEDVYRQDGKEIGRVLAGADLESFRGARDLSRPELIKLHGDYKNAASRIFTTQEYDLAYQPDGQLSIEFKNVVFNYSLLFMGASLNTDRTISLLQQLAPYNVKGAINYAFLSYIPDNVQRTARQAELMESRILPIWFPIPKNAKTKHYDLQIEALLAGLLYHSGKLKFSE